MGNEAVPGVGVTTHNVVALVRALGIKLNWKKSKVLSVAK